MVNLLPGPIEAEGWVCPAPLRDSPTIVMGHGGGGALSAELVEHLFLPAFGAAAQGAGLGDAAVVPVGGVRLAMSTDSYVVKPLFFPGGSIGDLAVNGTVNDLSMSGARPLVLSTAFILAEGTRLTDLGPGGRCHGTGGAGRRRPARHRRHEGGGRGLRRRRVRQHHRARARSTTASTSGRNAPVPTMS